MGPHYTVPVPRNATTRKLRPILANTHQQEKTEFLNLTTPENSQRHQWKKDYNLDRNPRGTHGQAGVNIHFS